MRLKASLLLVLLGLVALSGCFGDGGPDDGEDTVEGPAPFDPATLSQPLFSIREPEEVWVTASDGKMLNNALYRPDTNESVPVFINFSPYWGDTALQQGDPFSQYLINEYVPRGFAVVLSAIRGTGHSQGCFEIGSDRESEDVYDVVDHFANQPWSNGNVAAGGKSYDSTTQNGMVAKFPHPALKGIFHVSGITDMYRYTYYGGVPYTSGPEFTTRYFVSEGFDEYGLPTSGAGTSDDEDTDSIARALDDAACPMLPQHVANSESATAAGAKTPYWTERDWTRDIAGSSWNGSIFFVHGLQDWNVKPDNILPWVASLPDGVKAKTLGWLHQWTAGNNTGGDGHVYPMRTDWNETMLRWLDFTLKGKDTRMDELWGFEVQDMNAASNRGYSGTWRRTATWPPLGEAVVPLGAQGGAVPFGNETHVTGAPYALVTAMVTDPNAVLSLALTNGNGWVTDGVLRAAFKDGLDVPAAIVPGQPYAFRVDLYPVDLHLAAGDSLQLAFGGEPRFALATPVQLAGVTYLGAELHLPVALDAAPLDPQPTWMECFTC